MVQAHGHRVRAQVAELFAFGLPSGDYPTLRAMLSKHCRLNPCLARLEWLAMTDVANLTTGALGFVQRNMAHLIPTPQNYPRKLLVYSGA